ncbi:tRNA (adenosine(37)-N6)-threonylcarbamoyltransferase complex transferase subunit TsaD [Kordiimonas sp. SCSIO 12603]|uniref:tRNA (adenosine(37)-N6)-threonylcarbamoyltransferase complex transferase subunit TsaD n=1 Tax=Kordiimonas sp. SCSIO 12603 TaxID=2829596 RepID=UPI002104109A|nr:tRNA (adenosine(37)-N6)-threonylcarbamoyltransferase complex transferase subunit TsaD [Kordiimonas sp. SCSIO 12603]UTW58902.1 tRNA (adenosine(37)-N6)-threonylcarbamoyltransferase complex transferase subunit TsaD [Kordiimonas sp. SCSIO 12603]
MTQATETPDKKPQRPFVLGIETSCDETAAAIVSADKQILAHQVLSQIDDHSEYGGVVPEIAARQHISNLDHLVAGVLKDANISIADLDAVAATTGPGLVGGLMVGVMTAKAAARAAGKPYVAVNHLEGHALTARLVEDIKFPYLLLLVSGGHCQLLSVSGVGKYKRLGTTIDDAVGEAFDKTAKLLGLGYPGGPAVEKEALKGDPTRFKLPRPLIGKPGCDFSFSGLKTAVRRTAEACVEERGALYADDRADICAAFQTTIAACLTNRLKNAIKLFREEAGTDTLPLVVAGGVAANKYLRAELQKTASDNNMTFHAPPLALCTDNGAMIAWAGMERFLDDPTIDDFEMAPRARWPLDGTAIPLVGKGKKGAKA